MGQARYSIGIDLGTTNSAMAFAPLQGSERSDVFAVSQWDSLSGLSSSPTLPSFLYLPGEAEAAQLQGRQAGSGAWIVGRLARRKASEIPGRVAHSAKSWLCHHAADRTQPFLPWGSDDVPAAEKISPVRASALILNYLRGAWDSRFAASGADFRFDAQEITVTVPASFDEAAQRLTLAAAHEAGMPKSVRLLEEPQAAFYCWLERHDVEHDLRQRLGGPDTDARHVLVVDVGGGTSDFSLFELDRSRERAGNTAIRRLAVSDHILLGGDNIDLALAHHVEQRLALGDGKLSGAQWEHLVARCRDVKERALATEGAAEDVFPISVPGRGSRLFADAASTHLLRSEIEGLLIDGFFPACALGERPQRALGGLKEWGLPYAFDSAVTRHLAHFLAGRPHVDAVLFNGGSLYPAALRRRICEQITAWQGGYAPLVLDNVEPDLAVARGAAHFGRLLHLRAERIEAGAARAVFLETQRTAVHGGGDSGTGDDAPERRLVCVLPRGAAPEQTFALEGLALELRVNRPVRFQAYSSTRHRKSRVGDVILWSENTFEALPPLETVVKIADEHGGDDAGATLPVRLNATLSELGLLQVSVHSTDPRIDQSWPLDFNLRPHDRVDTGTAPPPGGALADVRANADPAMVAAASARITAAFSAPAGKRDKLTAGRLLQGLEKTLGLARAEWNWVLVRALWPALAAGMAERRQSVEHEEAWLIVAGFLLRPGYGAPMDDERIDALWRLRDRGLYFPGKRSKLQEYILWRRVAGGLARDRQESVLAPELAKLRAPKDPPPELVRLAGALERVGHEIKAELIESFIAASVRLASAGQHCAPFLAALSQLLNRSPLYAGPEAVVSADLVETAFEAFRELDWSHPELAEMKTLFLRAARVVDDRRIDVPPSLARQDRQQAGKAGGRAATHRPLARVRAPRTPGPPGTLRRSVAGWTDLRRRHVGRSLIRRRICRLARRRRSHRGIRTGGHQRHRRRKFRGDRLRAQGHADIAPFPPQRHLVGEVDAAEPAVVAAKQGKPVGVKIGQIGDMPGHRAEGGAMAAVDQPVIHLHRRLP
ncbi:MAG: Hsp70 family protein [Rhodospirillales bacterium]|nr:Hsp70 family protein [Rhodospirillales bacterium]